MSTNFTVPPLRIEVRAIPTPGAENTAPWLPFGFAQTPDQAAAAVKRAKLPDDWESQVVDNNPLATNAEPAAPKDTAETIQLLEQTNSDKLTLQRQLNAAHQELAGFRKAAVTPKIDALAGETPLPFGVGDWMRDVHTGVAIKVTELNPKHSWGPAKGEVRPGFAWENLSTKPGDKDHTGFCPLGSIGCFVKIKEGDPVKIDPSGVQTPAPESAS